MKINIKIIVAVSIILFIISFYIYPAISSSFNSEGTRQLSAYSTDWNQLSEFRESIETYNISKKGGGGSISVFSIVSTPVLLNIVEPKNNLFVVIGVEKEYTKSECDIIENFVLRGGKVIIADDGGLGNALSNRFGVSFYGKPLLDENCEKNPLLGIMNVTIGTDKTKYTVVMNAPTGLSFITGGGIMANSSKNSYIDYNGNGIVEQNEKEGPIPLMAEIDAGKEGGKVIFISDPDIFSNGVYNEKDNKKFTLALVNYLLPREGQVLIDESRHVQDKSLRPIYTTMGGIAIMTTAQSGQILVIGILLVGCIITMLTRTKEDWVHRFNIWTFKKIDFIPTEEGQQTEYLRQAILQRVKDWQRFAESRDVPELEFDVKNRSQLAKFIDNPEIIDFILDDKRNYTKSELKKIITSFEIINKRFA